MTQFVVLVAGGTGFLGARVVELLQAQGHRVIVSGRHVRMVPTHADVIINLVGIIREDEQTYEEAHVEFTRWLVGLGRKLGVRQFVQVSALGASLDGTPYQRTKAQAERIVAESGLPYAIIRPSIVFGPRDKSINRFRAISRTGFFPVLADGVVQPVSVDTVAQVIIAAAQRRIRDRTVEIGGPESFTWAQLADRVHPGVRTFRLPGSLISALTFFGEFVRSLPTEEQVAMMRGKNTTHDRTVERLGIKNPRLH